MNIKIAFVDFWNDFNPNHNFFTYYFKRLFPDATITATSIDEAQFVMYSCFGNAHAATSKPKIFYTGENTRPDFTQCDYSFTFDYDTHGGKNVRLPLWYMYIDWFNAKTYHNPQYLIPPNQLNTLWFTKPKPKTCCAVFSRPTDTRTNMLKSLSKYFNTECYGKPFANWTDGEEDKYDKISQYKASLCFERDIHPGYVTEKLLHARTAGNLAIYYGHPSTELDFNKAGYVNAYEYKSWDACAEHVNHLLTSGKYKDVVNQPIFATEFFTFDNAIKDIIWTLSRG